jgi:hypothetical protein
MSTPGALHELVREHVAELLAAFDATGHGPFREAAAYLDRATYCERGEIDDSAVLAERERLETLGLTPQEICARLRAQFGLSESDERRIRQKRRRGDSIRGRARGNVAA